MSLKKLPEYKGGWCPSPSHNPPSMMVYENGSYEWTCPDCGSVRRFRVEKPTLTVPR